MLSSNVKSGNIVGTLFASIVLPVPGGPINNILCIPLAEISNALLAFCCPFTSEKSNKVFCSVCFEKSVSKSTVKGVIWLLPCKNESACFKWQTGYTVIPFTSAASSAFSAGTIQ